MNSIYGEPKLNIKKVIIALVILFVILILSLIIFIFGRKNSNSPIILKDKSFLIDNCFNITFKKDLKIKETIPSNNFLLELHSENDFNFYISKIEGFDDADFSKVAESDYHYYPLNFESIIEISDLEECTVKEFPGYKYNLKYLDSNTTYFLQVYILKINNLIYTFNIQIPAESVETMAQNIDPILNTIEISESNSTHEIIRGHFPKIIKEIIRGQV